MAGRAPHGLHPHPNPQHQAVPTPGPRCPVGKGPVLAGPGSVGDGGAPPPTLGRFWGAQDRPSPMCWGCHWGPTPRELSGFPGSPLTDSEEPTLPPSPGPAGRSCQGHTHPHIPTGVGRGDEWGPGRPLQPHNGPRCRFQSCSLSSHPQVAHSGDSSPGIPQACGSKRGLGPETPNLWAGSGGARVSCDLPAATREQRPKSGQAAELRGTGQLGLTG